MQKSPLKSPLTIPRAAAPGVWDIAPPRRRQRERASSFNDRLGVYVRQLCVLGIESKILAPALLEATSALVGGSDISTFVWAGVNYEPVDFYCNSAELLALRPEYLQAGGARVDRESVGVDFPTAMRRGYGFGRIDASNQQFARSEGRQFYVRAGVEPLLECTLARGSRGLGSIVFAREVKGRSFSEAEESRLKDLLPHLVHAIQRTERRSCQIQEPSESGIVVADLRGRIVYADGAGQKLILLCSQGISVAARAGELPYWLMPLVQRLRSTFEAKRAAPPRHVQKTIWGEFSFRCFPLHEHPGQDAPALRLVAIEISQYEPLMLRIMRGSFELGLSPRQREICVRLAGSASYASIARQLRIKESTVIDHVRKMYVRLDINERAELLTKIRAAGAGS